jgi:8-oxo-dGTP pyrophosphatase MutT (NUDIX family)
VLVAGRLELERHRPPAGEEIRDLRHPTRLETGAVPARPEVLALVLLRHPDGERILVSRGGGFDRLLGGKVEHGELTHEAAARELLEELDVVVAVVEEPRQVLQVRFVHHDRPFHQVHFVHDASFVDPTDYQRDLFERVDREGSHGVWRSLVSTQSEPLYPEGLDLSR